MTGVLSDVADGRDVVASRRDAPSAQHPLLVVDALAGYLRERGIASGRLRWRRIGDGQSNITFEVRAGERRLVLRRGPRPPVPPSAHDMLREARVQQALAAHGMPVPPIVDVCADPDVLGVPFYVMEFVAGDVLTGALPFAYRSPGARRATVEAAVDALVALHAVPVDAPDIAALGRPAGYLQRQVDRFATLWSVTSRRTFDAVDAVARRLAENVPGTPRAAVVHGDYRIGNVMFAGPGRVRAILDWEMATLGDPLADLGYLVATYGERDAAPSPMDLTPVTREAGFPMRADLVARYAERTGADVSMLAWYEALALWKAAIFCEAIYTRWLDGQRPGDAFGPALEHGVPALLASAAAAADRIP